MVLFDLVMLLVIGDFKLVCGAKDGNGVEDSEGNGV